MDLFFSLVKYLPEPIRILDVGGTAAYWKNYIPSRTIDLQIVLLNLEKVPVHGLINAVSVIGDARDMKQFADKSFDVCFSNSTIEHVGSFDEQLKAASEIRRIAQGYFIQTPNFFLSVGTTFSDTWLAVVTN